METVATNLPSIELYKAGQGPWLDTISRKLLRSGTLKAYIEESGLLGVTSNPSIFQQAISQGEGYEQDIQKLVKRGASTIEIYDALTISDIRETCDLFLPVFQKFPTRKKNQWQSICYSFSILCIRFLPKAKRQLSCRLVLLRLKAELKRKSEKN